MIEDSRRTPLKAMVTTPSCVPAVPGFEDTGSSIDPDDVARTMGWESVVGLGEMMNFPGVLAGGARPLGEVAATLQADGCVTGHYSVPETDRGLNAYVATGVRCCHESTRAEDVLAKMRLGMYAQLREGSAWHDLAQIAPAIADGSIDTRMCNAHLRRHAPPHAHQPGPPRPHPATRRAGGDRPADGDPDGHHQLRRRASTWTTSWGRSRRASAPTWCCSTTCDDF